MDWTSIAAILSAVILIGGAGAAIAKWLAPLFKANNMLNDHEKRLKNIEEHEVKNLKVLEEIQTDMKLQNRAMLSVVNHMIDGNGIDKLKASRDELQDLLMK